MGKKRTRKFVREREEKYYEGGEAFSLSDSAIVLENDLVKDKLDLLVRSTPQDDLLREIKKDKYRFFIIILFSLLLHLSAVTIFKIVVYVPRSDLQYIDIKVVQVESPMILASSQLRISGGSEDFGWSGGRNLVSGIENKIELPQLEFEEMEKLRLRSTLIEEIEREKPLIQEFRDSWAQFGVGVSKIRESLSALSPFGEESKYSNIKHSESAPVLRHNIGNNIEITYRCLAPPYQRKILFVPLSLDITGKLDRAAPQSFEFLLEVNFDGNVVRVADLSIEGGESLSHIKELVEKIKFEPLFEVSSESREIQQITMRFKLDAYTQ